MFGDIQDRMEKQDAAIAKFNRGQQHEAPTLIENVANDEHVGINGDQSYNDYHYSTYNMCRLGRGRR